MIIKSTLDELIYSEFVLENGIKGVYVQDDQTKKSVAVMKVLSGWGQDSADFQGLAHFLEHMLFIGSKKYPKPDYYTELI